MALPGTRERGRAPSPQQLILTHACAGAVPGQEDMGRAPPPLTSSPIKNILNFEGFSSQGSASQCQFVIELAAL